MVGPASYLPPGRLGMFGQSIVCPRWNPGSERFWKPSRRFPPSSALGPTRLATKLARRLPGIGFHIAALRWARSSSGLQASRYGDRSSGSGCGSGIGIGYGEGTGVSPTVGDAVSDTVPGTVSSLIAPVRAIHCCLCVSSRHPGVGGRPRMGAATRHEAVLRMHECSV
jgi:hypothetical protein